MRNVVRPPMPDKFDILATYNSEVARGLLHSEQWKREMATLQEEFNAWVRVNR